MLQKKEELSQSREEEGGTEVAPSEGALACSAEKSVEKKRRRRLFGQKGGERNSARQVAVDFGMVQWWMQRLKWLNTRTWGVWNRAGGGHQSGSKEQPLHKGYQTARAGNAKGGNLTGLEKRGETRGGVKKASWQVFR